MHVKNPLHTVELEPTGDRVVVSYDGVVLADTTAPIKLHETGLRDRWYVPRDDVRLDLLERTARKTHCPYKGDAAYFSYPAAGPAGDNIAWTYEHPIDGVEEIGAFICFYAERTHTEVL